MHYILSLDPGVTTGIAYAEWDGDKLTVKVGQLKLSHEELYQLMNDSWQKDFDVIYERFDYRNAYTRANLTPVEMIGVIKFFCESNGITPHEQAPSVQSKTSYFTDVRLKSLGMYAVGYEHGRSATKHLLSWWQFGAGYKFHNKADFTNYALEVMPKK